MRGSVVEVAVSGRVVLGCRGCGERVILLGREDDWQGEGRLAFRCPGCSEELTLADRVGEVAPEAKLAGPRRLG